METTGMKNYAATTNEVSESLLNRRLENQELEQDWSQVKARIERGTSTSPESRRLVDEALQILLRQVVSDDTTVSDNALETLDAIIASLDEKLSEQINSILHHPEFQKLEGSWRGLEHLVFQTETSKDLKVRVLNISKEELGKNFKRFKGSAWDQSPLFKKIYSEEFGMAGGQPYGVLVGDYSFDHSAPDVDIIKGMGQIAAASHAPFVAGAAPALLGINSWENLNEPQDLAKVMDGPEWAAWRGFRKSEDSRYVSLALPRFLSRLPYGKDNPVEGLAGFRETCEGGNHSKYTWSNAAYALATNITQAHTFYGWTACIRGKNSGGAVTGLHVHTFPTADGGTEMKCPTEVSIPFRKEHELSKLGLTTLVHWKNSDEAAFVAVPSVFDPPEFYEAEATANAKLNGSIPYLMVVSRFSHFLNKMLHDAVGSFHEKETLEKWLNDWITNFVLLDGKGTDEQKAKRPLSWAEVRVEEVEGQPGYYNAVFLLRPHYQLEGVNASLRLVSGKKFNLK